MKIAIVSVGTRGDVDPHAALCAGLIRAGFDARLCAPVDFAPAMAERGIPFDAIPVSFQALCGSDGGTALLGTGNNGLSFLRNLGQLAREVSGRLIQSIRAACAKADAVCYSPLGLPAAYAAREEGIPAIATGLQPLGRTASYPNPLLPLPDSTPRLINRLSYGIVEGLFWHLSRPLLRPHFNGSVSQGNPFRELYRSPQTALFGYSPALTPRPDDWKPWMHVTGYWTLDPLPWSPPRGLVDFLKEGPAICVGFGSMTRRGMNQIVDTVLDAIGRTGRRAVLLTGWSGYAGHRNGNVYAMEAAPHGWLFPRVTAVIHHGGAGTTAAALRAGTPSIILPFFFDQHFWARWLARRGLGPEAISLRGPVAARVVAAIEAAEQDMEMQRRVTDMGSQLRSEDGVARAVEILGETLRSRFR